MTTKICTVCKEEKPISAYYKHGKGSQGQTIYKSACKDCTNTKTLKKYHELSEEEKLERSRIGRMNMGKDYFKNYKLEKKYGITIEDYNSMLDSQGNLCYICRNTFDEQNKPHVDHNHETGEVRKLLCHSCNTAIGHLKEDVDIMKKAIEYIEEHKE